MAAKRIATRTPGIYRRGSRWNYKWKDALGKWHSGSAATRAEAVARRADAQAAAARGEVRDISRVTFAEYACGWIMIFCGRTRSGLRPESRANYARTLGVTIDGEALLKDGHPVEALAFFGQTPLSHIRPRDIRDYLALLRSRGLSPNSVRLHMAALRVLFATAYEDGEIHANPCSGIRVPISRADTDHDEAVRALTDDQLAALIAALPPQHRPLVIFLARTGLRISEALELRWGDVDLGSKRIHVRRRLYRGRVAAPKSRYGRRTVPLNDQVAQLLWQARGGAPDSALVFPSRNGGHLGPSRIHRWFKPAARAAGIPWAGPHTLRHTCATGLFRAGVNAKAAQIWLGHHSPAFTLAVYTHLLPDDLPESPFAALGLHDDCTLRPPAETESASA